MGRRKKNEKLDFSLSCCIWQPFPLWSPENTAWFWEVWGSKSGKLWILSRAGDWAAFILFLQKGRVCLTVGRGELKKNVSFTLSVENPFRFSFPHLWRGDKSWQPYGFRGMFQTRTMTIVKHVGELISHKNRLHKQKVCSYQRRGRRARVCVK